MLIQASEATGLLQKPLRGRPLVPAEVNGTTTATTQNDVCNSFCHALAGKADKACKHSCLGCVDEITEALLANPAVTMMAVAAARVATTTTAAAVAARMMTVAAGARAAMTMTGSRRRRGGHDD